MTSLLKSRLLNFYKILKISRFTFLKIFFDNLHIKKDIADKQNFIKIMDHWIMKIYITMELLKFILIIRRNN